MQTLCPKVVQGLFLVYFFCQAQEPVVRSRSTTGNGTQEASVGSRKSDAVQLLEVSDRLLRQGCLKPVPVVRSAEAATFGVFQGHRGNTRAHRGAIPGPTWGSSITGHAWTVPACDLTWINGLGPGRAAGQPRVSRRTMMPIIAQRIIVSEWARLVS